MSELLNRRAFSLVEVLISLAIMSLALLTLVGVLVSGMKAQDKTDTATAGQALANQLLDRTLWQLANTHDTQFWTGEFPADTDSLPFAQDDVTVGRTVYHYAIFAEYVVLNGERMDSDGNKNGLKRIQVRVWWSPEKSRVKAGVGKLEVSATRIVNERHDSKEE